jgi:hypothetical protein
MQRTAALSRIEKMRFSVGPKSNQLTALGNTMYVFPAVHSRGVEAAAAASIRAGHKEAEEGRSSIHRNRSNERNLN